MMIQRIQTIFMFLAAVAIGLLFAFPMAESTWTTSKMILDGEIESTDHPALMAINALIALIIIVSIFLYKNRKNQVRLNGLAVLLIVILPSVAVLLLKMDGDGTIPQIHTSLGSWVLPLSILLLFLANRFIKKDEKLVRSADRLR